MFAALVAASLFIAATLHHSRDNLKLPEAIKSWTYPKSAPSVCLAIRLLRSLADQVQNETQLL